MSRLRRLAATWRVSRAEVVRRAVAMADADERADVRASDVLKGLQDSGAGLVREEAEAYLADVREDRHSWRAGE